MPRNLIADRIAFTHELTGAEASAGILSIDDDLALLALAVEGELKLADGSELKGRASWTCRPVSGTACPPARA